MCSSSPTRTLKLQLIAEQPLTGECWIQPKKITQVQGQRRSPSKKVGGVKSHLESNPIPARDTWRAQTNLVHTRAQRTHRDWARTVFKCLLCRYRSEVACCRVESTECSGGCMGPFEGSHHYLHYLHHSLASGQTIGRVYSTAHQHKTVLKIYWAWTHPSEKDPVSPSVSPIRKLP